MAERLWNRRSFLKFSLSTAALAMAPGKTAWARPAVHRVPEGRLSLLNVHTGEKLAVTFRDPTGEYDLQAVEAISHLLRCHHSGAVHEIDLQTIEFLHQVDARLGGGHQIEVISGFRSPEYNSLLRQKGRKVAAQSLHLEGRAVDIRIPRVSLDAIRRTAVKLQCGGVGYYPRSGFVHLDSGDFRTW